MKSAENTRTRTGMLTKIVKVGSNMHGVASFL